MTMNDAIDEPGLEQEFRGLETIGKILPDRLLDHARPGCNCKLAVDQAERPRYAEVLSELMAPAGRVLLVVTEHEPAFGPPHSVDEAEVRSLFEEHFAVRILSRTDVLEAEPHWRERGATSFSEAAYLLTRRPPSGLSTREARKKFRTGMRGTASTRPTPPAAG